MPHRSQATTWCESALASEVMGADPHRLVALLLAGARERLHLAQACMLNNEPARKGKAIGEVCAIIGHLDGSLDHEAGGEIAGSLSSLYVYLQGRLVQANLNNDAGALQEAQLLLGEIESAWSAIPESQRESRADVART